MNSCDLLCIVMDFMIDVQGLTSMIWIESQIFVGCVLLEDDTLKTISGSPCLVIQTLSFLPYP